MFLRSAAIIKGLVAVPIIALIMILSRRRAVVEEFGRRAAFGPGVDCHWFLALTSDAMVWTWIG